MLVVVLAGMSWAADFLDPCSATSSTTDVRFSIALQDARPFQPGEIIPVILTFTSGVKDKYIVEDRNYDRSGRLDFEYYCAAPSAPDPLRNYRQLVWGIGGGLGGQKTLDEYPFRAQAELNEWLRLGRAIIASGRSVTNGSCGRRNRPFGSEFAPTPSKSTSNHPIGPGRDSN